MNAPAQAPVRALLEAVAPVAGSMCAEAAAVVFESDGERPVGPAALGVAAAAATEAAELSGPRERVQAGPALGQPSSN